MLIASALFLHTGRYPPHSRYGDVLWLSLSPGSDGGPWSPQGGSHGGHGHDRRLAGHDSLSCNSSHLLYGATMRHLTVILLMDELGSLWELAEKLC